MTSLARPPHPYAAGAGMLLLGLLCTTSLACGDKDAGDSGSNGADGGSSADGGSGDGGSADGGSGDGGGSGLEISAITVEISPEVATVATVSWTTSAATVGHVEFGQTEALGWSTDVTASGTEHDALLLGMPAATQVYFQVVVEDGDGQVRSDVMTVTTGSLPSGLPTLEADGSADQWNFQVVPLQGTSYVVAIVDNQGRYVWYDQLEPQGNLMRAFITTDRQWMVYCLAGPQNDLESGVIRWVSLDGLVEEEVSFPMIDHDMTELPDGSIAAIVVTPGEEGTQWQNQFADSIVELHPDGTTSTIWNAWEYFDFDSLDVGGVQNVTHGNALDYDPEEDVYYIALKTLGSIAKVDRATGNTEWVLNGRANQFTFPEGTEIVELQHQFEKQPGGILIFDNGPTERGYSRVVELSLDEDTLEAEQIWEYIRDPSVYVFAKGDVARFDDGTTQVVWSASGEIENVTPEGENLWRLNTSLGQAITFVQILDDLYQR